MSNNTKRITFRVDDRLHQFLTDFAREKKMEISQICRNVIISYFMSKLIGEFKSDGLSERFFKRAMVKRR
jgi:hypothetical protein